MNSRTKMTKRMIDNFHQFSELWPTIFTHFECFFLWSDQMIDPVSLRQLEENHVNETRMFGIDLNNIHLTQSWLLFNLHRLQTWFISYWFRSIAFILSQQQRHSWAVFLQETNVLFDASITLEPQVFNNKLKYKVWNMNCTLAKIQIN